MNGTVLEEKKVFSHRKVCTANWENVRRKILRDVLRTEAMPTNHILVNPLSDQQLLAENGDDI